MRAQELDRLRRAFASLDAPAGTAPPPPSPDDVWCAAAGELDPDETRVLAERLVDDPRLAREWRLALDLVRAQRGADAGEVVPLRPRWRRPVLAIAAAAMLALGAAAVWRVSRPASPVYRAADRTRIEAIAGDRETLPRDAFVLRWSPVDGAARYRVTVSDSRLDLLHEADEVRSTSLRVPPADLERIAGGERVLWQVTATTDDGARIASPTFVATLGGP